MTVRVGDKKGNEDDDVEGNEEEKAREGEIGKEKCVSAIT